MWWRPMLGFLWLLRCILGLHGCPLWLSLGLGVTQRPICGRLHLASRTFGQLFSESTVGLDGPGLGPWLGPQACGQVTPAAVERTLLFPLLPTFPWRTDQSLWSKLMSMARLKQSSKRTRPRTVQRRLQAEPCRPRKWHCQRLGD